MTYSDDPTLIDVQFLKGVGPKKGSLLKSVGINTVEDILYHFPRRYLDRSKLTPIAHLSIGDLVTVVGTVRSQGLLRARKKFYEVLISDDTGTLPLIWFGGIRYVEDRFKLGMTISVSGTVADFRGPQLVHPEYEIIFDDEDEARLHTGRIIPLYPSTAELKKAYLDSRGFRRIIQPTLKDSPDKLIELLPESLTSDLKLLPLAESIRQMHYPDSFEKHQQARVSLALRELVLFQIEVIRRRSKVKRKRKPHHVDKPDKRFQAIRGQLPFKLTKAQDKVLTEIFVDLFQPEPMRRLLQGDVASGKTVVAALAMALVARCGFQAALMAPTEILAKQHYKTISRILDGSSLRIELLTGSTAASDRGEIVQRLEQGEIDILIGTHVLNSKDVQFHQLAFAIVDEQHRFGVAQREALLRKGKTPDLLVMTATPIPRTLALTAYGDLDLSVIDQLPSGRKPVKTALRTDSDRPKIYRFIKNEVADGNQVFIIFPLVDESDKMQLKAATKSCEELSEIVFPELRVGLVHGRMKRDERDRMMTAFADNELDILVATTVVEVGIDIPDATVIVIEHAERFGLSQLHQLRGRVGRSDKKSYCILMTEQDADSDSYRRLQQFIDCADGFKIAELDLSLRGPGDLLGVRQAGMPLFKIADLASDMKLILTARECADKLASRQYEVTLAERERLNDHVKRRLAEADQRDVS